MTLAAPSFAGPAGVIQPYPGHRAPARFLPDDSPALLPAGRVFSGVDFHAGAAAGAGVPTPNRQPLAFLVRDRLRSPTTGRVSLNHSGARR